MFYVYTIYTPVDSPFISPNNGTIFYFTIIFIEPKVTFQFQPILILTVQFNTFFQKIFSICHNIHIFEPGKYL